MDNEKHVFEPKHVDYELSPYTGLTRESWIEAAEYLLGGIFQNIKDFEDPVVMPRRGLRARSLSRRRSSISSRSS